LPRTPPAKGWLDELVRTELGRHEPQAALAGLPADVRGRAASGDLAPVARLLVARSLRSRRLDAEPGDTTDAFLDQVRLHVHLLLDLGAVCGAGMDAARRRAEIASFLAAALGDVESALEVVPVRPITPLERDVERALRAAELALVAGFHPPADPVLGLPLHPGSVSVLRRRLGRVAAGFHRDGRLDPDALARHALFAESESVLLAEAFAGLLAAPGAPDERARAVRQRQVARLGLSRAAARDARAAIAAPRAPAKIAAAAPATVRPFLVEQLFLAQLRAKLATDASTRFVEAFVAAAGLEPEEVAAARVEAAAQHGDHQVWFEAVEGAGAIDWQALAGEWGAATDAVVERVSSAVTDNLGAIVAEIRQTGELGQLLARAAAGATLTADERRKVRVQLIDLAKAVPALAIFAAPGGMLLLPLLAKLLPFNLLPSAWDRIGSRKGNGGAPKLPPKRDAVE
jgi:hypothetical protein